MHDPAAACCCDAIVARGFFGILCYLGACFVAFVWILTRPTGTSLEDEGRADGRRAGP